ncbi:MAG: hypothetical protein LAN18_16610 [Acidobacteriia bacterium]|nr:hypothetical protein [Terriglobia bacterium]
MTIAVCIKINDGVVLASDSATTILGQVPPTGQLMALNVYNNANKIYNLRKGLSIGAITWGAGSIGQASISTIVKDLRQRFTGDDADHEDWKLSEDKYIVEDVANRLKEFVFDELYQKEYTNFPFPKPSLGFIVAGYSGKAPMADEFQIDIQNGQCIGPRRLRNQEEVGLTWAGEPEALNRLIIGRSTVLPALLQAQLGVPPAQMNQAMANIQAQMQLPVVLPAMPLKDAIDLAEFMVDLTIQFSRFKPGAPTVGGPIEIAAISKHEGFRWVQRKHYFTRELNPEPTFERHHKKVDEGGGSNDKGKEKKGENDA